MQPIVIIAAAFAAGSLMGCARRPVVQVQTVPLALLTLLGRLGWVMTKLTFRLLWAITRFVVREVRTW